MIERDLQIFIDGLVNYFDKLSGESAEPGVAYVKGVEAVLLDYTGIIGISGGLRGCVYYTAPSDMLMSVAQLILPGEELGEEVLSDVAGEVANTLAGNAQYYSDKEFEISVPAVMQGIADDLVVKSEVPNYVIPIHWRNFRAYLVVGFE